MANITRTLADTAGFIPQAWGNTALAQLRKNIGLVKVIARDSDFTEAGWKGKTLNIPFAGTLPASDKTPGSLATVSTPSSGSSVNVTLSYHKTVDFILEDIAFDQAQSGINMMNAYGEAAGVGLAEQLESDLFALVSGYSNLSVGTIGTDINYAALVSARKAMNDAKAPMSDRSLFLSTKDYAAALKDSSLLGWFQFQNGMGNGEAISEAGVRRLMGFDVYESQFVPASGTAAHTTQTLVTSGSPTGGYNVLTYNSNSTGHIAYNATAAVVEAALNAITGVAAGQFRCSGTWASNGTITVVNEGATPLAITGDAGANLTGGSSPTVTVNDVSSSTVATSNLALHKNSMILAVRPMSAPTSAGVEVAYANDPVSGLGLRIQMQYQPQYRGVYVAYDLLYGASIIRPTQAQVILA